MDGWAALPRVAARARARGYTMPTRGGAAGSGRGEIGRTQREAVRERGSARAARTCASGMSGLIQRRVPYGHETAIGLGSDVGAGLAKAAGKRGQQSQRAGMTGCGIVAVRGERVPARAQNGDLAHLRQRSLIRLQLREMRAVQRGRKCAAQVSALMVLRKTSGRPPRRAQ